MGPRSEDRGDVASVAAVTASELLQWGRGPKTAETIRAHVSGSMTWKLQWGRGPKTAETRPAGAAEPGAERFNGAAVRRPRRLPNDVRIRLGYGGFNGAAVRRPRRPARGTSARTTSGDASMGPRSEDRGDLRAVHGKDVDVVLQWGRGPKTAETLPAWFVSR